MIRFGDELFPPEEERLGRFWVRTGAVSLQAESGAKMTCTVQDATPQTVVIRRGNDISCSCGQGRCAHMAAAILQAQAEGKLASTEEKTSVELGRTILAAASGQLRSMETVRTGAALRFGRNGTLSLALNFGVEKLYAVRSIPKFLTAYRAGENYAVSDKFTFEPSHMSFGKNDRQLIALLMQGLPLRSDDSSGVVEFMGTSEGRFLQLDGLMLGMLLQDFENRPFAFQTEKGRQTQQGIRQVELPLYFDITSETTELKISVRGFDGILPVTEDFRYAVYEQQLVRLSAVQAEVCHSLWQSGVTFSYPAREMEQVLPVLLPSLAAVGTVVPSPMLSKRLLYHQLKTQCYIDTVDGDVEIRVEFHYGDQMVLPFATGAEEPSGEKMQEAPGVRMILLRDGHGEAKIMSFLTEAGFSVRSGKMLLRRSKEILTFCTQGVMELGKLAEVFASTAFEKIKPRKPGLKAGFHMKGGHLVLSLLEEGNAIDEELPILEAIARRQQYVRLKNGEFLDIRDYANLSPVAFELLDAAALDDPEADRDGREINFGSYRATYLVNMLTLAGVSVTSDEQVQNAMRAFTHGDESLQEYIPEKLRQKLTPYQLRGAGWLLSLYEARMGGILADEMGLGKTVQVIAALSAARHKDGIRKSLIVAPTSLTYHWLAEICRFDDELTVRIITGLREQRQAAIMEAKQDDSVDVILTSYPLLRRDIDLYQDIPLRFAVLDEAQSVKNAQSQGATAAKELQADVRVALTGTPMENHTGELWSIFDFVLPGYLGTQASFLRRYGSGENAGELHDRIQPFLIRRLKKDVLANLPGKHEQYLYAAMTPEQTQIYQRLLSTLRQQVDKALSDSTLNKSRMQVLSLLLKLRQVCCHPSLVYSDYEGSSGKLELLSQTVQSAIENGHRILIFSQFVGMLQLIRKRLSTEAVPCLYLDGETKAETRQELCDRFNAGEGKVFLISLKAGGTGLNLTGADLVIHYDPWWNPAAEDQATDRAHRIGQNREVDVIRLITQGSIEEKVTDLSMRKRDLFDKVILAGETDLFSLSEEEIRSLFAG